MLSSEEDRPCNPAGVLALEEERFGLAVLEAEDLAVTADVKLALFKNLSANKSLLVCHSSPQASNQEKCPNGSNRARKRR